MYEIRNKCLLDIKENGNMDNNVYAVDLHQNIV